MSLSSLLSARCALAGDAPFSPMLLSCLRMLVLLLPLLLLLASLRAVDGQYVCQSDPNTFPTLSASTLIAAPTATLNSNYPTSGGELYGMAIAINTGAMSACEAATVQVGAYFLDGNNYYKQLASANVVIYGTQAPTGQLLYLGFDDGTGRPGTAVQVGNNRVILVAAFNNSDLQVYTTPGAGSGLGKPYTYNPNQNNQLPAIILSPTTNPTPLALYQQTCNGVSPTDLAPPGPCSSCSAPPQLPTTTSTTTSGSSSSTSLMVAPTDVVYGSQALSVSNSTAVCGLGIAINTALMGVCDVAQLQLAIYQTDQGTHVTQVAATANVNVYSTQAPNGQYLYIPFVGGSVQLNTSATYLLVAGFTAGSALQVYVNTSQSAPASGKFQYSPVTSPLPVSEANFNFHGTVQQSLVFAPVQGASCDCFTASTLQPISSTCASSSSTAGCRLRGASGHC